MDGILVLVLIGWLIKSMSSKNKKKKQGSAASKQRPVRFQKEPQFTAPKRSEPAFSADPLTQFAPAEGEGYTGAWTGSLNADSSEGEDLCDPSLGHEPEAPAAPQSVYAGEIGWEPILDTSPHGLLQGVIMSEILTRPAQRKHR